MPRKRVSTSDSSASPDDKKSARRTPVAREPYDKPEGETDIQRAARINHSEVEKRRRNSLNAFIYELASLMPVNPGVHAKKLDKLSILRLAVQFLRTLPRPVGTCHLLTPECLDDFVYALLDMDDVMVFVVDCVNEKVMASRSASALLGIAQSDHGRLYLSNILHGDDVAAIKRELRSHYNPSVEISNHSKPSHHAPAEPTRRTSDGVQFPPPFTFSFTCRLRRFLQSSTSNPTHPEINPRFSPARCFGIVKTMASLTDVLPAAMDHVAGLKPADKVLFFIARLLEKPGTNGYAGRDVGPPRKVFTRLSPDGKFVSSEEGINDYISSSESSLTGVSIYRYCHPEDLWKVAECHRWVLVRPGESITQTYRLICDGGKILNIIAQWKSFNAPFCVNKIEYILVESMLTNTTR